MQSVVEETMATTKPTRYVLTFGQCTGWNGLHDWTLTIWTQKDFRRVKAGESDSIIVRLDYDDWCSLQSMNKRLCFTEKHEYPYYRENRRDYTILERLFCYDPNKYTYLFKNGDKYDLKRHNVTCCPALHNQLVNTHNVVEYIPGHTKTVGQQSGVMKNPIWRVVEGDTEYMLMYCEKDTICRLCPESYKRVLDFETSKNSGKKLTFFKHSNGYITTHSQERCLFIHQVITGCYGNGRGTQNISVDHIDRDPLNNTLANLRIATREEQQQNTKGQLEGTKKARRSDARPLPSGITEEMVPKYVTYGESPYGTNGKTRSYFCIANHPNQPKPLYTSKSNKVSILEKLEEAKRIVAELDKREITNVIEVKPKQEAEDGYTLPQYFHLAKQHGKDAVCFERRYDDGKRRVGIKVTIKEGETIKQAVERIMEQVDIETGVKKEKPVKKADDGFVLPKGFNLIHDKQSCKQCLCFQRNVAGKRYVGRTFVGEGESITGVVERLTKSIKERYELVDDDVSVVG